MVSGLHSVTVNNKYYCCTFGGNLSFQLTTVVITFSLMDELILLVSRTVDGKILLSNHQ